MTILRNMILYNLGCDTLKNKILNVPATSKRRNLSIRKSLSSPEIFHEKKIQCGTLATLLYMIK